MNERIWFFTQRNDLVDLSKARFFRMEERHKQYLVIMYTKDHGKGIDYYHLGSFYKKDDAIDYIVRIRNILEGN